MRTSVPKGESINLKKPIRGRPKNAEMLGASPSPSVHTLICYNNATGYREERDE